MEFMGASLMCVLGLVSLVLVAVVIGGVAGLVSWLFFKRCE
jgi:hypothetical protein